MDIQQIKFIISNTSPFNKLKDTEIEEFLKLSEAREYKNGQILYRNGDPADYFYFILQGRIMALTKDNGGDKEIELLKRGTSFGIISLFNEEPHSVTARSIETSIVLRTPKDAFKDFLNRHPLISLEFYRLLSQRIRARTGSKKIFQCKRIGISGLRACGKTTYMRHLGLHLKEQTKKKVICVEISAAPLERNSLTGITLPSLANKNAKLLNLENFREDTIAEYIISDGIDYLFVNLGSSENFSSLLNFLSENYHFILYEIPLRSLGESTDELFSAADYLHFLVSIEKDELSKIALLINTLKEKKGFSRDRIKIFLNEFNKKDSFSFSDICKLIGQPVYATVPDSSSQAYFKFLRRIARQIGDIVVGLALGSGAAYGFSHVGVLKVLEENNIYIDIVCGSSIGAVIAALWALGYKAEEIEKIALDFGKKVHLFSVSGFSFPFKGFFKAKYLENILKKIFKDKTFYDLKHNLKVVVFDFAKRENLVLEEGLLYKVVAASCAMPGVFEPVRFKNEILLDGGILSPLPAKVLLNYGVNKIIAVNITPSREEIYAEYERRKKWHIFDFIFGTIETMQREFVRQAVMVSDVVIHPNFEGLGWLEFEKVEDLIKGGEEATRKKLEEIKKLT